MAQTVMLIALGFALYCDEVPNYGHALLEKTIQGGSENAIIIEGDIAVSPEGTFENDIAMQKQLYELEEIHGVGQWEIGSIRIY